MASSFPLLGFLNASPTMSTLTTGTIKITGINTDGIVIGNTLNIRDQFGQEIYTSTGTVVTDVGYQSVILNKPLISGGGDSTTARHASDQRAHAGVVGQADEGHQDPLQQADPEVHRAVAP